MAHAERQGNAQGEMGESGAAVAISGDSLSMRATTRYRSTGRFLLESVEGMLVIFLVLLSWPLSRRWLADWGSTPEERQRAWPGDTLVDPHHQTFTRAVTIGADPCWVWEWIAQFGLGRAGFYSYELLERVVGIPVRNVEEVLPHLQKIEVGDEVKLHPDAPGIPVAIAKPCSCLCFGGEGGAAQESPPDPSRSWSIYLEPLSDSSVRLLVRTCLGPLRKPNLRARIALALEAPIDFAMEQRMLRTVKRLAEGSAARGYAVARDS